MSDFFEEIGKVTLGRLAHFYSTIIGTGGVGIFLLCMFYKTSGKRWVIHPCSLPPQVVFFSKQNLVYLFAVVQFFAVTSIFSLPS